MENISERVHKILKDEGISIRSLEQQIGCSNGVLSKWILKKTDIGSNWISKIIDALPQYSANWIITGKGEPIQESNTEIKCMVKNCDFMHMIESKDQKLLELAEEIGRLKGENCTLKKSTPTIAFNHVAEP